MDIKEATIQQLNETLTNFLQGEELTLQKIKAFIASPDGLFNKVGEIEKEWLVSLAERLGPIDETDKRAKQAEILSFLPCPYVKTWEQILEQARVYSSEHDYKCNFLNRNFPKSSISYIGARTGRGKTSLLSCLALDALEANKHVYFITAEENCNQIANRLVRAKTWQKVKGQGLFFNGEKPKAVLKDYLREQGRPRDLITEHEGAIFVPAMAYIEEKMSNGHLTMFEGVGVKFEAITAFLESLGTGSVIIIDYFQHLKGPEHILSQTRQVQLQDMSHTLANIAAKKGLVILAAAQFKRPETEKPDQGDYFTESSFRECGDIEQDGHILIGLGQGPQRDDDSMQATAHFFT